MSRLIATSHNIGLILTLVLAATAIPTVASEQPLPRLVLQITVDQLRGEADRDEGENFGEIETEDIHAGRALGS